MGLISAAVARQVAVSSHAFSLCVPRIPQAGRPCSLANFGAKNLTPRFRHCNSGLLHVWAVQVSVPDVYPGDLIQRPGLLSMCAGDFVEVYSKPDQAGSFDCVATCFFLDTAHNILQYMQIIRHILKVKAWV